MPAKSDKQRRAMCAAAHGKSTLGIPKSVGREYCKADGGRVRPTVQTGSAAMSAPTVAATGRAYADGGPSERTVRSRSRKSADAERRRRNKVAKVKQTRKQVRTAPSTGSQKVSEAAKRQQAAAEDQRKRIQRTEQARTKKDREQVREVAQGKTREASKQLRDSAARQTTVRTSSRQPKPSLPPPEARRLREVAQSKTRKASRQLRDYSARQTTARTAPRTSRAVADTERANRQAAQRRSAPPKAPPQAPPKTPSRRPRGPMGVQRKAPPSTAPAPRTSASQAASGPRRQTRVQEANSRLKQAINQLKEMNKASYARARGHRREEDMA